MEKSDSGELKDMLVSVDVMLDINMSLGVLPFKTCSEVKSLSGLLKETLVDAVYDFVHRWAAVVRGIDLKESRASIAVC